MDFITNQKGTPEQNLLSVEHFPPKRVIKNGAEQMSDVRVSAEFCRF